MRDDQLMVRVPVGTSPHEIEEYFRDHGLNHDDYILHGRKKDHFLFTFMDKPTAMMFKLRFSG